MFSMRKLSLSILAASIAFTATATGAYAQSGHGPGMRPGGHVPGPGMLPGGHRPNVVVHHGGGRAMHMGRNFQRRLNRGFVVNPFWFGPQFHIGNWQSYGFVAPGADQRWIRYYDDAYLIDRGGRVVDTRYGLDWDQYGEEWAMEDGIPAYRGSRDWRPDADDYEWAERSEGHERHGEDHVRGPYGPPMPDHGYGHSQTQVYGGGYGYGYYAYPIIIETTVTTAAAGYSEEVIEEYEEVRRVRRPRRARPACACPAPRRAAPRPVRRPPPGERG
jgi:Ni/Co efflux regulator RcnB